MISEYGRRCGALLSTARWSFTLSGCDCVTFGILRGTLNWSHAPIALVNRSHCPCYSESSRYSQMHLTFVEQELEFRGAPGQISSGPRSSPRSTSRHYMGWKFLLVKHRYIITASEMRPMRSWSNGLPIGRRMTRWAFDLAVPSALAEASNAIFQSRQLTASTSAKIWR